MDIDPDGFAENVADRLAPLTRRVTTDRKNLKTFIEKRDHETGAWRGNIERPDQIRPGEAGSPHTPPITVLPPQRRQVTGGKVF
ncbi:hypothetical protein [Rhodococcus sp. 24CO]|uniref:hypothetical protein n=1 Tax=Rhodococcus sp. 24CO TaxID=3117460 RepID=UPI003D32D04A